MKPSPPESFKAEECLRKLVRDFPFETVLDVGCGRGPHTRAFQAAGKTVTPTDIFSAFDGVVVGDYAQLDFGRQFDCVWLSHVLEHQLNVNMFLKKVHRDIKEGGWLAITVPPLKHEIVGGHVTLWNAGLLLYNLILAGFDCRQARVKCYGYNISVITPKISTPMPLAQLKTSRDDMALLAPFFPQHPQLTWRQSVPGNIQQLNWDGGEFVMQHARAAQWRKFRQWFSVRRWFGKSRAA